MRDTRRRDRTRIERKRNERPRAFCFRLLNACARDIVLYVKIYKTVYGTFTVTAGERLTAAASKYYAAVKINGTDFESKPVKLTVKQGKVSVKSSASSVVMYRNDRYSRAQFTLSIADGTVARIEHAEMDSVSENRFRLIDLGNGCFTLEYKDSTFPASFKASTVKLSVYVQGCEKAVATVKLKVSCI